MRLKIIAGLVLFLSAGCGAHRATVEKPRKRHEIPKTEYVFPCIIENVRFEIYPDLDSANARCGDRLADDGKPLAEGEKFSGCFNPSVKIISDSEFEFSGTIISEFDLETIADEAGHLIFNACRKYPDDLGEK